MPYRKRRKSSRKPGRPFDSRMVRQDEQGPFVVYSFGLYRPRKNITRLEVGKFYVVSKRTDRMIKIDKEYWKLREENVLVRSGEIIY
jgi:hypothetical protein